MRRLLDDISRNRRLLTREIYVCHDGLPYDPDGWQTLPQSVEMKIWGLHASGASHYLGAHFRHETFDRLSGVLPANRWRNDQIKDSVFVTLRSWLETTPAERIIRLSHKFFAHAADASSRVSLQYSGIKAWTSRDPPGDHPGRESDYRQDLIYRGGFRRCADASLGPSTWPRLPVRSRCVDTGHAKTLGPTIR